MKKLFIIVIFIGTSALIAGGYYYLQYRQFLLSPVFPQTTVVNINQGQNFKSFIKNIHKNHASGDNWQWRLLARLEQVDKWLKVGEFQIGAELTPMQMLRKINANEVITYQFTIIEGMNWRDLKQKLLLDPVLIQSLADISDAQLLAQLDSDKILPEGLFLPETYQFVRGDSDIDVLKRAYIALQQGLAKYWHEKKLGLPLTSPYEMLTLASIVEKETSQASERETIAGVFIRRLQLNMRLQTDPTVIYGLGVNYDGDIKSKDLVTDTPYNTYTRKGLPPTPIAMASIESIAASANPQEGTALYFVANNRGGHYFSDTYEQHKKAVKKYLTGVKL
ncbi:FIG004453: protein YceG like [hydrothermal vent metagenome]|uniref:FIG004453: protein YceG like n=1 Tax=hydrothermal vent metagenome TaxID=652676 RepID=A0A3B0W2D6_9ZZZZ